MHSAILEALEALPAFSSLAKYAVNRIIRATNRHLCCSYHIQADEFSSERLSMFPKYPAEFGRTLQVLASSHVRQHNSLLRKISSPYREQLLRFELISKPAKAMQRRRYHRKAILLAMQLLADKYPSKICYTDLCISLETTAQNMNQYFHRQRLL